MDRRTQILVAVLLGALAAAGSVGSPLVAALAAAIVMVPLAVTMLGARRTCLAVLLLSLTLADVNEALGTAAYGVRLMALAGLLLTTVAWPRDTSPARSHLPRSFWRLCWCLSTIAVVAVASVLWSVSPTSTMYESLSFAGLLTTVVLTATRVWTQRDEIVKDVRVIFWTVTATVLGAAVLSVPTLSTVVTVYQNPNALAMTAAAVVLPGLGLWRHDRRHLYVLATGALAVVIVLTTSRTSMLAVAVACLWFYFRSNRTRGGNVLLVIASLLAATVSALAATPGSDEAPAELVTGSSSATDPLGGRLAIWEETLAIWRENPFLGIGFRTGESVLTIERLDGRTIEVAHSSYVQMLLELGVVGAALMCVLLALVVTRACRSSDDVFASAVANVGIVGVLVGFGESSLFATGQGFAWIVWLSVAMSMCLARSTPHRSQAPEQVVRPPGVVRPRP